MPDSENLNRPLRDLRIGISISDGEDLTQYGITGDDLPLVIVEICRRLVALGAQVVLGHQWRPKGIMDAVTRFAQTYQWEVQSRGEPIVHNFLAWPDRAALSKTDREQLAGLVEIDEATEPASIDGRAPEYADSLTAMRRKLTSACDATICLSGKMVPPPRLFVSGILEEAAMMLQYTPARPAYLSGMLGGMTKLLIDRITHGPLSYFSQLGDERLSSKYIPALQQALPVLADRCGLDFDELGALFQAQNIDTVLELVIRGLKKLQAQGRFENPGRSPSACN